MSHIFSRIFSAQISDIRGTIITVELDISQGLHSFTVVGMADKAVDESRERVGSAIRNSGYQSPKHSNYKTVVSLVPAEIRKEGSYFDLAIAIAYLKGSGVFAAETDDALFVGELSLSGKVRPVRGALPIAEAAKKAGKKRLFIGKDNAVEAALVEGITVYGVESIGVLMYHLLGKELIEAEPLTDLPSDSEKLNYSDMDTIVGQESAKRGLLIAAAGGHNVAMFGPPGTGKTLLASAFTGILPKLSRDEILEVTGIHSVGGILQNEIVTHPPLRRPHHSASAISIIGGGSNPRPGEVTYAHRGVLFLDEFPEFDKRLIESLRQPLEDYMVTVSRATRTVVFPARFQLVAAMNPCPCGYAGSAIKNCVCTKADIERYRRKLSGPIIDRIDMWLPVEHIDYEKLTLTHQSGESSNALRNLVRGARVIQERRYKKRIRNADIKGNVIELCLLSETAQKVLVTSAERLKLSPRSFHRVARVARTIADLEMSEYVEDRHILESLSYRPKIFET